MSNWRTIRAREAPRAVRIAISLARAVALARMRPAILAQAINSTSATKAISMFSGWPNVRRKSEGPVAAGEGTSFRRRNSCCWSAFPPGTAALMTPGDSASSPARTCVGRHPGFCGPMMLSHHRERLSRFRLSNSAAAQSGIATSNCFPTSRPKKPGALTPTIWNGCPVQRDDVPPRRSVPRRSGPARMRNSAPLSARSPEGRRHERSVCRPRARCRAC